MTNPSRQKKNTSMRAKNSLPNLVIINFFGTHTIHGQDPTPVAVVYTAMFSYKSWLERIRNLFSLRKDKANFSGRIFLKLSGPIFFCGGKVMGKVSMLFSECPKLATNTNLQ